MRDKKTLIYILIMILAFCISACSKSDKSNKNSDDTGGSNSSSNSKRSSGKKPADGIKITVTNIPFKDGYWIPIALYVKEGYGDRTKFGGSDARPVARGDQDKSGGSKNGTLDIYLYDDVDHFDESENWVDYPPFTKPGEYYIQIGYNVFYTDGKTLEELDIKPPDWGSGVSIEDRVKFPTYNLKTTGNIIDYSKQIISVSIKSPEVD